jgi:hypothetical protein
VQEREGAHHRLEVLRYRLSRLRLTWADPA